MTTQRLQAAFARKREVELLRTERTAAVDRYYNHWGKVTSKFENWTAPEYYEQAEEKLRNAKEKKEKEKNLKIRRERLRELLEVEKTNFQQEVTNLRRPKSRNLSTNVMEKIDENFKTTKNERRRLEQEAKLYGRWRHGVEDEGLLYESKSDNQVLAKLNWLDKQIEDQVQREQDEKMAEERALRMQEEIRKSEQHHKERQEIRKKEIEEIRAIQEEHMRELKEREQEADLLKAEANYLQSSLEHLQAELQSLEQVEVFSSSQEPSLSHNLRKIKMTIRKRSELFRDQLQSDISLLQRISEVYPDEKAVNHLLKKLQQQLEVEKRNISQIESMYESEAKVNLFQCEDTWRQLNCERRLELKNLLKDLCTSISTKFNENQKRQKELIDIRTTHLSSIETSNERLKILIKEQEDSPRPHIIETPRSAGEKPSKLLPRTSGSFSNLNLDCLGGGEETSQSHSARSQLVVTPDSAQRPKFGRKKVAWV